MSEPEPIEGLELRRLRPGHVANAEALSAEAGWNQTGADWRMMIEVGEGWGLWASPERLVATALVLPYGDRFAWISMVLVTAAFRRRGIAGRLLRHCVDRVAARGLTPVLDATEEGRKVYLGLGFRDVYGYHRRVANSPVPAGAPAAAPGTAAALRDMTEHDLPAVAAFDAQVFGADRSAVLAYLFARRPRHAVVAERAGAVCGFALAREGRLAHHLGPLIAEDGATAIALARRALRDTGGPVCADVPDDQAPFGDWLADSGFVPRRRFVRMILERTEPFDDPACVYAVAGPELG